MLNTKLVKGAIILFTLSAATACKNKKEKNTAEAITPVAVTISAPGDSTTGGIAVSGEISALQTTNISTRIMGTITRIFVKTGDKVHKGQLLVTINGQDLIAKKAQADAAIAEAEANVKSAQKDFERFTNLFNKQSASAKELDNVTLQYNSAKARLEAAVQMRNEVNALMSYTSLTAPFDGVITQKMIDEGSLASPGMPILTIEQNSQLQVTATLSEADINNIKKGNKADVQVKAINKKMECTVSEISPSAQFTGGQYLVKFNIPENEKKDLYAGMYVSIFIPVTGRTAHPVQDAVMVPVSSLVQNDQLTGLYTISSNNTALLRWIRTGKIIGDKIEVLSGLSSNEKFIISAEGKLYNGVPVIEKK